MAIADPSQARYYERNRTRRVALAASQRRRRRDVLVAEAGGACIRCGYDRCSWALQFHHRDPADKEFEIGAVAQSYGIERLRVEAAKCDLLCANCHHELHWEQYHEAYEETSDEPIASSWPPGKSRGLLVLFDAGREWTIQTLAAEFVRRGWMADEPGQVRSLQATLLLLCKEGTIERVRRGVYTTSQSSLID